jgi:hypothetical protein
MFGLSRFEHRTFPPRSGVPIPLMSAFVKCVLPSSLLAVTALGAEPAPRRPFERPLSAIGSFCAAWGACSQQAPGWVSHNNFVA